MAKLARRQRLLLLELERVEAALRLRQAKLERCPLLGGQVGRRQLDLQAGDLLAQRLQRPGPRVDLRLDVLDRDVLVDDLAERRQLDDGGLHLADRDPQHEVGSTRLLARPVLDRADVAAERSRQVERLLRSGRQVVDAELHLDRVELRPRAARRQRRSLSGSFRRVQPPSAVGRRRAES